MGEFIGIWGLIVFGTIFIVFVLLMRLLGAWMLRINDVINELKGVRKDIQKLTYKMESKPRVEKKTGLKSSPEEVHRDLFKDRVKKLRKEVKQDELIIVMKDTQELKIIKKSEHDLNQDSQASNKYIVVHDKNKTSNQAKVIYTSARLKFKRDEIEPLEWEDKIRIYVSNEGNTYEMTKRQFYDVFDNVVQSKSYNESGYYHSHPTPSKANQFIVNN